MFEVNIFSPFPSSTFFPSRSSGGMGNISADSSSSVDHPSNFCGFSFNFLGLYFMLILLFLCLKVLCIYLNIFPVTHHMIWKLHGIQFFLSFVLFLGFSQLIISKSLEMVYCLISWYLLKLSSLLWIRFDLLCFLFFNVLR